MKLNAFLEVLGVILSLIIGVSLMIMTRTVYKTWDWNQFLVFWIGVALVLYPIMLIKDHFWKRVTAVIFLMAALTFQVVGQIPEPIGHPNCAPGQVIPADAVSLDLGTAVYKCPHKGLCSWASSEHLHICECHFDPCTNELLLTQLVDLDQIPFLLPGEEQYGVEVHGNQLWVFYKRNNSIGVRRWEFDMKTRKLMWMDPLGVMPRTIYRNDQ
jgi:hypothetical protein